MAKRLGGYWIALGFGMAMGAAGACGGSGDTATQSGTMNGFGGSGGESHGSGKGAGSPQGSGQPTQSTVAGFTTTSSGHHTNTGTASGGGGSGGAPQMVIHKNYPCPGCTTFPGMNTPTCSSTTLGPPTLAYPTDGVLLPPNMNVLEVQFVPPTGAQLFEVDFENSVTDVRVETMCNAVPDVRMGPSRGCGITLPQGAWDDVANTNRDGDPVKVTVRALAPSSSCVTSSKESVSIDFAKDDLTGGIYYWQSATYGGVAGTTGGIFYHDFGTLDPTPTPFWTSGATGTCIGCHTLSKDGNNMSLMNDDPDADDEFGDVKTLTMDVGSRTVLGGGNIGPGFQTFSHDHSIMIASTFKQGKNQSFAVWTGDGQTLLATLALPGTGMGTGAGMGAGMGPGMGPGMGMGMGMTGTQPNLSADDKTLVFAAPGEVNGQSTISQAGDHHFLGASLWWATFDPVAPYGLSNFNVLVQAGATSNLYYPDQSVDGNWVVFDENDDNTAANNDGDCFYSRDARVKMVHFPPQTGDTPLDLTKLNVATGLSNSWPRWSPAVQSYKGHKILWVTFSSNRDYGLHLKNTGFDNYYPPESPTYDQPQPASKQGVTFDNYAAPQIWMAAVVIDSDRSLDSKDRSFPAFWLPFQDVTAHNHSAQWVATVQGGSGSGAGGGGAGGGGVGGGIASGTSGNGAGGHAPTCGKTNAPCGKAGDAECCSDVVCCDGTCNSGTDCIH